jgi:hypothetical protein
MIHFPGYNEQNLKKVQEIEEKIECFGVDSQKKLNVAQPLKLSNPLICGF